MATTLAAVAFMVLAAALTAAALAPPPPLEPNTQRNACASPSVANAPWCAQVCACAGVCHCLVWSRSHSAHVCAQWGRGRLGSEARARLDGVGDRCPCRGVVCHWTHVQTGFARACGRTSR
jgi:hypothetical protein